VSTATEPNVRITLPRIITGYDVEQHVEDTLKPRLAYYTPQLGYPEPRAYVHAFNFDKWPEDQVPAIVIVNNGINAIPRQDGDKSYRAPWTIGVGAIVSARTEEETNIMVKTWGGLIRATLLQQQSLGGFTDGITWVSETYDQLPSIDRRSLQTVHLMFEIIVPKTVSARELPWMPGMDGLPNPTGYTVQKVCAKCRNVLPNQEVK
jgi:hypothetical protein